MTSVKPASASLSATPRPMPRVPPVTSATFSLSGMTGSEEGVVAGVGDPADQQAKLEQVVVAPHAGLPVRDRCSGRNIVPAVGAMIDAVQEQPFVLGVGGEIRFLQQALGDGQSCLGVGFFAQCMPEANQSLGRDGAGGSVDGFEVVVGIGGFSLPVAKAV